MIFLLTSQLEIQVICCFCHSNYFSSWLFILSKYSNNFEL